MKPRRPAHQHLKHAGETPAEGQMDSRRLLPEAEPMEIQDIRAALVIRERDMFMLTDVDGQMPRGNTNGYGLYHGDTRYLSGYEFSFSTGRSMVLLSTAELGFSSEHVLTNYRMIDAEGRKVPNSTIEVHRTRVLSDVLGETVQVTNYNDFEVHLELVFRFAADFADIFVVRGYEPERHGQVSAPVCGKDWLRVTYKGSDGRRRETKVTLSPAPHAVQADAEVAFVNYHVSLGPREHAVIEVVVSVDGRLESPPAVNRFSKISQEYAEWVASSTRVKTDNGFFDAVLDRSLRDLRMLWKSDRAASGYPAAGTPWFDTLFGRDSSIAGLQSLWLKPDIARNCLAALARWQGKKLDSWRDEEPGKILHELRLDEYTQSGELPFSPYYGSIDSTPLFLMLAGEYYHWTNDLELLRQMEPNLRLGLDWMHKYGDTNGDGYLEYEKRSTRGLLNQGWKDSEDSMMHADGTLLEPPIAPVEVQAYQYAALIKLAPLFEALGDVGGAQEMRQEAETLRQQFDRAFWLDGCYALALDGDGRPAASWASNAGHALWGGIATAGRAPQTVQRLMSEEMFSGWGIRTLCKTSPRYNPQSYHNGTVWPHDNAVIAMGFKQYGFVEELDRIATGLFEAAQAFPYYRLPELFGGAGRSAHQSPVPYPVACRPQAWAAGSFPMITQALLGLCADAPNRRLYVVRPTLPRWLESVDVSGLRVGQAKVHLLYERRGEYTDVAVKGVEGDLDVVRREDWPALGI